MWLNHCCYISIVTKEMAELHAFKAINIILKWVQKDKIVKNIFDPAKSHNNCN